LVLPHARTSAQAASYNAAVRNLIVVGTRIFLGLIFFTSGMGKLTHGGFVGLIGPVWLEEKMAQYGLGMWAVFVAWSQVTIGLLLLSQRFAVIGSIMLVPMIANIFVITVSMKWPGTPYVNAVFLAMNALLLWSERHRLKLLFIDDPEAVRRIAVTRRNPRLDLLCAGGIALCLIAPLLYRVHARLPYTFAIAGLSLFVAAAVRERMISRRR
jgi:uncharacterized membrane protein YphA (DoxX/SURF4 family)